MTEARQLEVLLVREYGVVLPPADTARLLGYKSTDSLARARLRGRVPVRMFTIPGRRGWFAKTADVAAWIQRYAENDRRTPP